MSKFNDDFEIELSFDLDEADDQEALRARVAKKLALPLADIPLLEVKKKSIDARRGRVRFFVTLGLFNANVRPLAEPPLKEVKGKPVIIVGAGPAGIFCAYELARHGLASIVVDRGKKVQARRRDLKSLNQHGIVNADSNYCFGEGGAGTYSDGKLYTRSHKRGDVRDVMEILALHGAPEAILTDARPHIGSNRLPKVVTAMRERLQAHGVTFVFDAKVTDIVLDKNKACGVITEDGREFLGRAVVLASGHSARDIYDLCERIGARLEPKAFAMGVRIEHPQPLINQIQYGAMANHPKLRAAPYRLAYTPPDGRGAFSFCMCPGGFIVPASTLERELVVNGMSLARRDSPYANSGLVVALTPPDFLRLGLKGVMAGINLQREIEQRAWQAGGGALCAPAQRATDFVARRKSSDLPKTSYQPGLKSADMGAVLLENAWPMAERLREALRVFDQKMPGYLTSEAVVVGVESRSSSPVRIVRNEQSLESPTINNLYPCGEGAGYAGGIISAAIDGIRVAQCLTRN